MDGFLLFISSRQFEKNVLPIRNNVLPEIFVKEQKEHFCLKLRIKCY